MASRFDEEIDRREVPALKVHKLVLGADGMDLFAAGVADMNFRVADVITEAMTARAAHGVFGYETVPDGLMPALISWMKGRHNWDIEAAQILRSPNVLNTLAIAASLFSEAGDSIIIQPPVFFDFKDIISENGRELLENPLILRDGRYEMDFDGLEGLAANPRAKMIFLCNPHNPVGRVWSAQELRRLGDICARHDVLVVADEIHGDITFDGFKYTPFASLGTAYALNSITCLSPAKSFNIASCCSAFSVVPDVARRMAFQAENSRLTVNKNNAFASVTMTTAYGSGGVWLDEVCTYLQGNLALVEARLATISGVEMIRPEGTFLVWMDFRALGYNPEELTAFLRVKARWALTRGQAFGREGEGFGRLNIACRRADLMRALDQLAEAVEAI